MLDVDDDRLPAEGRRYALSPGHAEVLLESDSPLSMAALTVLPLGGVARALPALVKAYRSGEGVADAVFGEDWRNGHSGANRAIFAHQLPGWIRTFLPAVHRRLMAGGTIADVACGAGLAALALARAYPQVRVIGIDLDAGAIDLARAHATRTDLGDRLRFDVADAAEASTELQADLVCLFDALHEIARPVKVLRSCRRLRAPGGEMLVMDARVAPVFRAPGDEIERFQYATSVLHCLPAGRAGRDSVAPGTVMRVAAVERYAREAGFADVRVLPAEDRFHRLYHLIG